VTPRDCDEDPARAQWFLTAAERRNPASDIRVWTVGNHVEPLVDGAVYFASLYEALTTTEPGDQVYLVDFRGDTSEELAGPGTDIGGVLSKISASGVKIFGLIWRAFLRRARYRTRPTGADRPGRPRRRHAGLRPGPSATTMARTP
jgi:hypothetical protein